LFGLEVHGFLGVVLWNVAHGNLSRSKGEQALDALKRSSLWLSEKILEEARKAVIDMTS
jgi:predicted nucleic acid-binding protein